MPTKTRKSPADSNKGSRAKLSSAEKEKRRKRLIESREKARLWAENEKLKSHNSPSTTNHVSSSVSSAMKKRKAAASPPPSSPESESSPEGSRMTQRDERRAVEVSPENNKGHHNRDDTNRNIVEPGVKDNISTSAGKSSRKSSRVKKRIRQSSPVPETSDQKKHDKLDVQTIQNTLIVDRKSTNHLPKFSVKQPHLPTIINPYKSTVSGSTVRIGDSAERSAFSSPIGRVVSHVPKVKQSNMIPSKTPPRIIQKTYHIPLQQSRKGSNLLSRTDTEELQISNHTRVKKENDKMKKQNNERKFMDFVPIRLIFSGIIIYILLIFIFTDKVDLNVGNFLLNDPEKIQCFDNNTGRNEAAKFYNGQLPMIEIEGTSKFVPPELQSRGISKCNLDVIPCPTYGLCFDGFLFHCNNLKLASPYFIEPLIVINDKRDSCELSHLGKEVIEHIQNIVESSAVQDTCSRKRSGFNVFGSSSTETTMPVSFSDISKAIGSKFTMNDSTDNTGLQYFSSFDGPDVKELLPFLDRDVFQVNMKERSIELTELFLTTKLSIPFSCWVKLLFGQICQCCWNLLFALTFSAAKYYISLLFTQPVNCLLSTMVLWLLSFIIKQRQKRSKHRKEVAEMRELAYDMLVSADDSYAVTHLRDTITHRMFPISLNDRSRAAKSLWPKVVTEVNHDSRIRKIEKNIGGLRALHWEWISVPARKERRSLLLTPKSNLESKSEEGSPTLKDLKRNLL